MSRVTIVPIGLVMLLNVLLSACNSGVKADPRIEEPPQAEVVHEQGANLVKVEHPEQYPVAIAAAQDITPELSVTGVVSPDVSRNVPVISLTSGRVLEVRARLGDHVTQGQLLVRIQSPDISAAFSDYRKAVADETLARAALERARLLFSKGAIAQKELETAVDAEDNAKVNTETGIDRLKVLGADVAHPSPVIDILAPISGVITEQNVTAAGGVKSLDDSPNLFTIADLSHVWITCDIYENDLPKVNLNDLADVRLNAYPGQLFQGRISDLGPILDSNVRTVKARIEVENPGLMRLGMVAQATLHGQKKQTGVVVPASAIVHLQDRDWAYVPQAGNTFRRVEVRSGEMVPAGRQVVLSGIRPGDRVVKDALVLESANGR
jgi:cobalt-zinc-cadmium efflux system membrane fusion protein